MHRWPLRLILVATLAALLVLGLSVNRSPAVANGPTTTTTATTTPSGPSTTRPVTTTTRPPARQPVPTPDPPLIATGPFSAPRRGCHFSSGVMSTTSATTTRVTPAPVHALGHCVVLEIGDSLGNDLGWGLARELRHNPGVTLHLEDISSTGLVTAWYYNWPRQLRRFLHRYHPHLVIMSFGANDEQGIVVNGHAAIFGSPEWYRAYAARVLQITRAATKSGAYVLWVGLPIMESRQYREGAQILNTLYASVATTVPGVTYVSIWKLFANSQGHYQVGAHVNNVPEVLRASDGIHYDYFGEDVAATYVINQLARLYHVALAPEAPTYITR